MKKKYLIILLLTMILIPFKVFATGGFGVSTTSISMYPGESKTITISTNNAVGKLNISSSNGGVASASPGSIFIQNPGSSGSITITGNSVGTATISVVASSDFATMDEEILAGQTKTITINVVAKSTPIPTPKPEPTTPSKPNNNNNSNNISNSENSLSQNNNLKSLSIYGHELVKVDNNNYTLTVKNDVSSININATAEDEKAKISGIGSHDLNTGENNIEIIITAESGAENKINIKVTRKEGYYLEDLESVLKDSKNKDINIIIDSNSKISSKDLNKIKDSKKIVNFNYYDENKKLIYSWIIDGSKIKNTNEFLTSVSFVSEYAKEISKLSNYADGLYVNFKHTGKLPEGTKIRLYVGDKFNDNSMINVYHYDKDKKELKLIKNNVKVKDKYIELSIDKGYEHFLTMSNIVDIDESSNSTIKIVSIVELTIIVILIIVCFIKIIHTLNNKKK